MQERGTLTIALIVLFLLVPLYVAAHGSGSSWEKQVGGYHIDIGYDPNAQVSGASDVFDFALVDAESQTQVETDELWVRLVREGHTILATGLKSDPMVKSTLLYAFEHEGEYVLHASFRKSGATLAEGEFPFTVAPRERSVRETAAYGAFALALLACAAGSFYIGKARR